MTLEADIERFPLAAAEWDDLSAQILAAREKLEPCRTDGYRFGILAESVGDAHDLFIGNVYDALAAGSNVAISIGDALQATGRDFGMTDDEQARYLATTTDQI
ncbi:hypothetical protein ASE01_08620 [Nocardioides sp. Root190]|uniref:hypothetical protein n=1 Tax=Nocardioides sp. Root190 TaxID=1736488 RepID=UPI0006FBB1B7|nr:hypothetical protein [Nocardioides sp. Root190]KRB78203.1 hypothetical protein ASE01_08620 [Nocardioides sp. Root190]